MHGTTTDFPSFLRPRSSQIGIIREHRRVRGTVSQSLDIDAMTSAIKEGTLTASNEEELKIHLEQIFGNLASSLGLAPAHYEYTFVSGGRIGESSEVTG